MAFIDYMHARAGRYWNLLSWYIYHGKKYHGITIILYHDILLFSQSEANYTIECIIPVDTFITNTLQEVYNIFIILLSSPLL